MTELQQIADELKAKASKIGVSMSAVCDKAEVNNSTFVKWQNGQAKDASFLKVRAMFRAIEELGDGE